jgi:hypothetical protein
MGKVVIGAVDTPERAAVALERLAAMGLPPGAASMLFPDRRGSHDFGYELSNKWPEGGLAGAAVGFVGGAVAGAAIGLGLVAVPALGILTAAGPVIAALALAAPSSFTLGVLGMILGGAVPEILAKHYAGKVLEGRILVAVHADDAEQARHARAVLRSVEAANVRTTGESPTPASARA